MAYRSNRKRRYRIKIVPVLMLLIIIALVICFIVFLATGGADVDTNASPSSTASSSTVTSSAVTSSTASSDAVPEVKIIDAEQAVNDPLWNLILVNRMNELNGDMRIEKTKFDTQYVDSRAAGAYQELCDAAKKDGITLYLRSGYRSVSTQQTNYNADVERNIQKGFTREEAVKLTEQYYARAGQSEHHTGLAFDIITPEYHNDIYTLDERFAETEAYAWLIKNCADYGFILRYPKDKVSITLINYEPWHYRYVGVEHAKEIMSKSICLEEYLSK